MRFLTPLLTLWQPGNAEMVTRQRLMQVLSYDPATGDFHWLVTLSARALAGSKAGYLCRRSAYVTIRIDGVLYAAHRLAFLYVEGKMPKEVDHEDLVRSNNKWANLRRATHSQNLANCLVRKHSKSGVKGVRLHRSGKWTARIRNGGVERHLGQFATIEEASLAYQTAAQQAYGAFARGGAAAMATRRT